MPGSRALARWRRPARAASQVGGAPPLRAAGLEAYPEASDQVAVKDRHRRAASAVQPHRPRDHVACDLLVGRVDAQLAGDEAAHLVGAAVDGAVAHPHVRVGREAAGHGGGIALAPGALEGERRKQLLGAALAVVEHAPDEGRVAVELRGDPERPRHLDLPQHDGPVGPFPALDPKPPDAVRVGDAERLHELVDLLHEVELLVERQVPGQRVAAVEDVDDRGGLVARARLARRGDDPARVDLQHPDLVGLRFEQLLDRRVLGEEAVPVEVGADPDGREHGRDGGGGEHRLDRDARDGVGVEAKPAVVAEVAAEDPELARHDLDRTHAQHRARRRQEPLVERGERDVRLEGRPEPALPVGRQRVRALLDEEAERLLPPQPGDDPVVHEPLRERARRVVVQPEALERPPGLARAGLAGAVLEQGVPGQQGANGAAGGAAEGHEVVVRMAACEQLLERARREGRVAAAALAGDGDPPAPLRPALGRGALRGLRPPGLSHPSRPRRRPRLAAPAQSRTSVTIAAKSSAR